MRLFVVIPIWGSRYVDRFLAYALPSLMAPGNLPALAGQFDLEVLIYTSEEDAARLREPLAATGLFSTFKVLGSISAYFFASCHPGTMMKQLFQMGFDRAFEAGAAFAPVCADAVYSDGFFAIAGAIVCSGKRAAMTQGSGVSIAAIGPFLDKYHHDRVMAIEPRVLMDAFMKAAGHGEHLPTWPGTRLYPAQIFWPVGERGAVMRCCHMYPVILAPDRHIAMWYSPDNDLVERALTDYEQIGWLDDSDQGFFFGLADPGHASLEPAKPAGDTSLENFCRCWMSPWKARYFGEIITWHSNIVDDSEEWTMALEESNVVVGEILETYRRVLT